MLSDIDVLEGLYARFLPSTHTGEPFDALRAAGQPWNGIRATSFQKTHDNNVDKTRDNEPFRPTALKRTANKSS